MSDNAPLNSLDMGVPDNLPETLKRSGRFTDPLNYFVHENRDDLGLQAELDQLLKETYKYRSGFYHEGRSGPSNAISTGDRYLDENRVPIPFPSICEDDFNELGLDTSKLWNKLHTDGFIKKGKFEIDKIHFLDNEYFGGLGGKIRQVFYRLKYETKAVVTFGLMAHIGRVAITNYYMHRLKRNVL